MLPFGNITRGLVIITFFSLTLSHNINQPLIVKLTESKKKEEINPTTTTITTNKQLTMQYDSIKGSAGLEALANLCGGASKAPDNEPCQQLDNSKKITPNKATSSAQSQTASRQLEQFQNSASIAYANSRQGNDSGNSQQQQSGMSHGQMNPQVAALINAGLSQQNIGQPNIPLNDNGAMALQQMVYLNLLQNQNVSNLFNQQHQSPSPQFVDQSALAMVLALQQQQQQQAKHDSGEKQLLLSDGLRNPCHETNFDDT